MNDAPARYAVIGHPIAHSLSPLIHAAFARQTGRALTYEAIDIVPADLAVRVDTLASDHFAGLNVTIPHKPGVLELCEVVSQRAQIAGAANTLTRVGDAWHADTTDGPGLIADLTAHLDIDPAGGSILIVGAGGSAWSLLGTLLAVEPERVIVANRTPAAAERLVKHFAKHGAVEACGLDRIPRRRFDLVINATSTTLQRTRPAIPPGCVRDAHCYDLMYARGGTTFSDWCFDHGARSTHTGIGMLVEQAACSFEIWHGARPDTRPIRAHLREEMGFTI